MLTGLPKALVLSFAQAMSGEQALEAGGRHGLGEEFRALVFYESSGCLQKVGSDGESFGCAQVRQIAACDVDRRYCAERMDEQTFRQRMVRDDAENMRLGSAYLAACRDRYGYEERAERLTCYAVGPTVAAAMTREQRAGHAYARAVEAMLDRQIVVVRVRKP